MLLHGAGGRWEDSLRNFFEKTGRAPLSAAYKTMAKGNNSHKKEVKKPKKEKPKPLATRKTN